MKLIRERLRKPCAVCGKSIKVILYKGGNYRGGNYFGRIPLYKKGDFEKALKAGTRKVKMGKLIFNVLKKGPKPYKRVEYWECQECYSDK